MANTIHRYGRIILLLVVLLTGGLYIMQLGLQVDIPNRTPVPREGVLDLRGWDLARDGNIRLEGDWAFYWSRLLTGKDFAGAPPQPAEADFVQVPEVWNRYNRDGNALPGHGYATYRLRVLLDGDAGDLGLNIPTLSTAFRVFIDDRMIAEGGQVAASRSDSAAGYASQTVTFKPEASQFDLIVQISNYLYARGGMWYALELGDDSRIRASANRTLAIDMLCMGSAFMLGLYHFVIFLLRRADRSALYFGICCLVVAFRLLVVEQVHLQLFFPDVHVGMLIFIEYFMYYCGIPCATLFIHQLYPRDFPLLAVRAVTVASALFLLSVILLPVELYTRWIGYFHIVAFFACFSFLYSIVRACLRRRDGAWMQLLGASLFVFSIVHDILYNNNQIDLFGRQIIPFGFFLLLFIEAAELARRFSNAFRTIEGLSDKLLGLNKMKDEFLANTSHELKTPLHGIINILQSLLEGAAGPLSESQGKNMTVVISAARRLANLINDILDFSKLKNSDIPLQRTSVDVGALLNANLPIFRHYIGEKPIKLRLSVPDDLPLAYADGNRLLQILYNLIGNAIKFTERGEVVVEAAAEWERLRVSVSDTGIGIPADKMDVIFQSFEQIGTGVAKEYGGVGLGLQIARQLVQLHGGELTVSSQEVGGSTFAFTLPLAAGEDRSLPEDVARAYLLPKGERRMDRIIEPELSKQESADNWADNRKPFTLLAVDDDPVNLQVVINTFARERYQVLLARNGEEAMNVIAANLGIDLVLLDVMMPGMSGYEACRLIRAKYSLLDMPVLLLTVKNAPEDLLDGFAAGANDFLTKPFYTYELRARVNTLLEMKRSGEFAVESELAFLRAQIKPHFLFNALNTIVSLSLDEPRQSHDLLIRLSSYLRSNFDFKNRERFVSLRREIELIEAYLYIEKTRFAERLRFCIDADEEIDFMLPPLTIQPLVENAVHHGVLKRKEGGTVKVSVAVSDQDIAIVVEDDGVGIKESQLAELFGNNGNEARGVGLRNIQQRMLRMYGHGLEIASEADRGTTVTVRFPLNIGD